MGRCDLGLGSAPKEAAVHGERDELGEAELAELVDYLAGELGPEQGEALRRRLETDVAYAMRAQPVIAAWTLTVRSGAHAHSVTRRESETRAAWHLVRQRIAGTGSAVAHDSDGSLAETGGRSANEGVVRPADRGGDAGAAKRGRSAPVVWRRRVYRGIVVPVALSLLAYVVGVYGPGLYLILGPGWVQGHMWRAVHHRLHRPIVDVVTNHGNAQLVRLPDGSSAVLDLMTWLSYPEHMGDVARNVWLIGRARFTVAPGGTFPFEVAAGPALLRGGTEYTVDHTDPSQPVTVWVTRGEVAVRLSADEEGRPIMVSAGHVVRVTPEMIQVDTAVTPPPTI